MASSLDVDTSSTDSPKTITCNHPYTYSIASSASSSSSSVFSVDAPSSQSSTTSPSTRSLLNTTWGSDENDNFYLHNRRPSQESIQAPPLQAVGINRSPTHVTQSETRLLSGAVSLESRQHPRRTQRLLENNNKTGSSTVSLSHARPPPSLVRQCERKGNFVDSLVDTTTQMIETIWPLSVLSCPRDSVITGKDQPLIGLRTFVQEVLRRSKTSYSTLQLVDSQSCRAMQCGRRMFLAALILASKYLQDRNFSARAWSKISGLKTQEINMNEMAFLSAVNWKLHIPDPVFNRWTDIVLKYSLSPSTHSRASQTPASPAKLWRSIIPYLTPDLDQIHFGAATVSNLSGYSSPIEMASRPSSTIPVHLTSPLCSESSERVKTKPHQIPNVLEPTPLDRDNELTLPPLPRLGLLPTPTITPQMGTLSTPAASTFGLCSGRSSMSVAMAQVQSNCLARSTLDNLNYWKPTLPQPFPTSARRSSLALSSSALSSPESMISDVSSRSSRSSSISSVSSICALSRPRLAVQATRRCANMQLSSLKENDQLIPQTSPSENSMFETLKQSPDDITTTESDYFTRLSLQPVDVGAGSFGDSVNCKRTSTHEAAAALHDLALDRHRVFSSSPSLPKSRKRENPASNDLSSMPQIYTDSDHRTSFYPSAKSRKRERQSSTDLSVQECVREIIAPRYLGEVTYGQIHDNDNKDILPDPVLASSFLISKKNSSTDKHDRKDFTALKDHSARKRACAAMKSRWDAGYLDHFAMESGAPGMWEGII